jgi:hypothetical protein
MYIMLNYVFGSGTLFFIVDCYVYTDAPGKNVEHLALRQLDSP